jgi:hypothetical protein
MCDVFCPACNGTILVGHVTVVRVRRHPHVGHSLDITFGPTAICVGCSLVSEVSNAGQLIDLGNITLADLEAPFVPGMFEPRVLMQSGSTLLWRRRDS